MLRRLCISILLLAPAFALACAGPSANRASAPLAAPAGSFRANAAQTAEAMIGAPYRYGGSSPRGFDCSGLVIYSFARTGMSDLPHSATSLQDLARPVSLEEIEPGDLLFFRLGGRKTSHVAIYVGGGAFVHAPSSGKRVEKVSLDHVYWGSRLGQAGRLEF